MPHLPTLVALCAFVLGPIHAETAALKTTVQQHFAIEKESLLDLYKHLHSNPELSFHEEKTSARLAEEMRKAGLEVTEKVGGWGVVAVLKNGPGKTLLIRTDTDALPVREITGLPFASKVIGLAQFAPMFAANFRK